MESDIIIKDGFLAANTLRQVDLILDNSEIRITSDSFEQTVQLRDVIGVKCERSYLQGDVKCFLTISAFPTTKNEKRAKLYIELAYEKSGNSREQNYLVVKKWHDHIHTLIASPHAGSNSTRPFLVFVNPHSGSGRATRILLKSVFNVWNEADFKNQIVITEYENHAKEFIKKMNIHDYRGVIVISGDGLIFEVLNGLMEREDWQDAIKLPVGQIPAGSANGLASSVAFLSGEKFRNQSLDKFASQMAFYMTRFEPRPIDLMSLQLENGKYLHSFMNVEWSIVADVDTESERYRFMGEARFILGAFIRIMNPKKYRGRVSFLPVDNMDNYKFKNKDIKLIKNSGNYANDDKAASQRLVNPHLGHTYKHLKPFGEKVPNDWYSIEDEFVIFLIIRLPMMGVDFYISPESTLSDGHMVMAFNKKGVSKWDLIRVVGDSSSGNFLSDSSIDFVRIKAFRLEPYDPVEGGNLMVDGEKVDYGAIQGEIMPGLGRVLCNDSNKQ